MSLQICSVSDHLFSFCPPMKWIRSFRSSFSWADENIEDRSINEFQNLIKDYCGEYSEIDADRQDEICKMFYKKLPAGNLFTYNFMDKTKMATAYHGENDTIINMVARLARCLHDARTTVIDAASMGGINFKFESRDDIIDYDDSDLD